MTKRNPEIPGDWEAQGNHYSFFFTDSLEAMRINREKRTDAMFQASIEISEMFAARQDYLRSLPSEERAIEVAKDREAVEEFAERYLRHKLEKDIAIEWYKLHPNGFTKEDYDNKQH